MEIRYVIGDEKGWLLANRQGGGQVELPEYLKVEFIKREKDASNVVRDYFKVLEGRESGTLANVRQKSDTGSWLGKGNPGWRGAAQVKFSISRSEFTYPGGTPLMAVSEGGPPVPLGMHDLELPDVSHRFGEAYLGTAKYSKTWFFIGHGMNSSRVANRYLHAGRVSAGCVTIKTIEGWDKLYKYLILSRKGDGRSVGTISVVP